jgi:hypothetical protein
MSLIKPEQRSERVKVNVKSPVEGDYNIRKLMEGKYKGSRNRPPSSHHNKIKSPLNY